MELKIALIGQTNVGKSTLFNKLVNQNLSLIHHCPNLTRDRRYGILKYDKCIIKIIDTAGIEKIHYHKDDLEKKIFDQTFFAIQESDLVLFIFNAQYEITNNDKNIINIFHKRLKSVFIIVNKVDLIDYDQYTIFKYYYLGVKDIFLVSLLKNFGLKKLKDSIISWCKNKVDYYEKFKTTNQSILPLKNYHNNIVISIVGKPNVGKSTLLNSLLNTNRSITHYLPGTTRDSVISHISFLNYDYTIIDTAGIKNKNDNIQSLSVLQTFKSISDSLVSILVLDGQEGVFKQDMWILNTILHSGKLLLILINKSEKISIKKRMEIKKYLFLKYKIFNVINIHFISALYKIGIKKIFFLINDIYNKSQNLIKTSKLNKIMNDAVCKYPLPYIQGKRIQLKYAHIGGYNPLIIIIHGNRQILSIPKNYQTYLKNFFQNALGLQGMNMKIFFKNQNNPYVN